MNKTLAIIDAIEQRLALLVAIGIAAYTAADPHALPPKYAAIAAAAAAIATKLAPRTAVGEPILDPAPVSAAANPAPEYALAPEGNLPGQA